MSNAAAQNIERRIGTMSATKEGRTIEGYAALFNSRTEIWPGFYEEIAPGAFKNAIQKSDIRALFNHEADNIIGRNKAGTLVVIEDDKGLYYKVDTPETTVGNDLIISVKRGDITQSSFAFTDKVSEWSTLPDGSTLRRLIEADEIFDVSPVTYPAYHDTTATARKMAEAMPKPTETEPEPVDYSILEAQLRILELDSF